jgi:HlyD family secretion protein
MKDDVGMNDSGADISGQTTSERTTSDRAGAAQSRATTMDGFLKNRTWLKPQLNRWWVGGAVVVLVLIYALWPSGNGATPTFRTVETTRGPLTVTVTATGTLQPVNTVEVGAEISGQIETVLVDYNANVTKGQVLAVMDTDVLKARVAQSRASLAAAKARVEDARATAHEAKVKLGRIQELNSRGNASKQELDAAVAAESRARAGLMNAAAQVNVSEATLLSDETTLAKAEIKSPIDGVVLARQVEPGQTVAASLQTPVLFKLAEDLSAMELVVDVDEADIGQVKEAQSAEFTVAAFPDRKFPANISQVRFSPKTVEGVVTYQAVLTVDNKDLALRPGMTATAAVVTVTMDDTLLVPAAALRFQPPRAGAGGPGAAGGPAPPGLFRIFAPPAPGGQQGRPSVRTASRTGDKQTVWVLDGGRPKPLPVVVGPSDGQLTSVSGEGLTAGTKVIVGTETTASR